MFDYSVSRRQVGIRQRSLRRQCRAGRATELVFVLATGAVLMVGGQAQAQVTWTGGTGSQSWDANGNWDTGSSPLSADDVFLTTPGISAQPNLQSLGVTINSLTMSTGQIEMTNSSLTAATSVNLSGGRIIVFDTSSVIAPVTLSGTGILDMRSGGILTGDVTINDGGTFLNGGVLGNNMTIAGVGAGQGAIVGNSANSSLVSGTVTLSGDARIGVLQNNILNFGNSTLIGTNDLTLGGPGQFLFSGGTIAGSGNLLLVDGASVKLFNASSGLTGSVSVTGASSRLELAAENAILNASSVVLSGGSLIVDADNEIKQLSGSGGVNVSPSSELTLNTGVSGTSSILSGNITGGGALAITGSGTQVLAGTRFGSGTATISSGTLQIGNGGETGTLGSGAVTIANGARLVFNRSDNLTVGNTISGAGNVFQSGSGTVTLTGSSRDFIVTQGTLDITTGSVLEGVALGGSGTAVNLRIGRTDAIVGAISVAIDGGSTITYGNAVTEASTINLNAPSVNLAVASGDTATQSGDITTSPLFSAASVTKQGDGTLIFDGDLIYFDNAVGTVTVAGGTLDITGSVAGNVTVGAGARLRISNSNAIAGNISTTGSVVSYGNGVTEASALSIGSATTQLEVLASQSATQAGVISGTDAAFGFEKIGGGLLNVSAANTYTGPTVISAGTLLVTGSITSDVSVGNNSSLDLNRGTITGNVSKTFGTSSLSGTINGGFTQNQGATVIDDGGVGGTQTTTVTGVVDIKNGSLTVNVGQTLDAQSGMLIGDGVSLSGNDVLTINGSTLGDITMTAEGRVVANSGTAIADDALVTVNNGLLQINADETIGGLAGPGSVQLGANTLTVAGADDTSFGGVISGTGELTNSGTGALTLTGANTFTGAARVNGGGALAVTGAGTLATPDVFVSNNSTFQTDGGALASSAIVRVLTGSTFRVTGNETLTGISTEANTTVDLDGGSVTITGNPTIAANVIGSGGITASGTSADVLLSGTNTYEGVTRIVGGGSLRVSGGAAIRDTGAVDVVSGTFELVNSETIGTLSGAGTVALNSNVLTVAGAGDSAFAGNITGALGSGLTKSGAGTLTLTGTNTYTGLTTIAGGTLQVGDGGTSGTLGTGAVFNDGLLRFNRSDDLTVAGVITGDGSLVQAGSGTVTLTNNTGLDGTTTISDGTLALGASVSFSTASLENNSILALGSNARLRLNDNGFESNGLTTLGDGSEITAGNGSINNNAPDGEIRVEAGAGIATLETETLGDEVNNAGLFTLTSGSLDVVTNGGAFNNDTTGNINIGAGFGDLAITGDFVNRGTLTVTAGGSGVIAVTGDVTTGGNLAGNLSLADREMTVTGALAQTAGTIEATTGAVDVTGAFTQSGGGATAGTVAITAGSFTQNNGTIGAGTSVTTAGAQTLQGGQIAGTLGGTGDVTVQTGTTTLTGAGAIASGSVDIASGALVNNSTGGLSAGADVTVSGGTWTNNQADTVASVGMTAGEIGGTAAISTGTYSQSGGELSGTVNASTSATLSGGAISGTLNGTGDVMVQTGTTTLTGAGTIANGSVEIASGELVNDSTVGLSDTADVTVSGGTWTNNEADTVASVDMTAGEIGGTADITTGTYSQSGGELSATVLANTSATLEGGTISGELGGAGLATVQDGTTTVTGEISADVAVAADGVLDVTTGEVSGDLAITAGTVTSAGTLSGETTVGTDGTLTITDGTAAAVVNSGTSSNAGTVASLENLGGTFANTGTISGATQIDGGVVTNTNTGIMTGQIDLSGGELITSNTAGAIVNNGGTVDLAGGSTGAVTNTAGTVNVSAATTVAGTFTNDAALNNTSGVNVALTLTGTGTMFTNNGTIDGNLGELTITAESIELGQTSIVNGNVRLDGNTINSGVLEVSQDLLGDLTTGVTGQTTVVADVSGNGNSVSNNNAFTVAGTFTLNDVDVFTNNATTVIEDNATLSAGVINNAAGSITLGQNASLIGTSNTLDNDAAIIVGDGGLVEDAGEINNNAGGSIQFLGGGTLNADSDNNGVALTNRGAISSDDGGADVITLGDGVSDVIVNTGTVGAGLGVGSIIVGETDTFRGTAVTLMNEGEATIEVRAAGRLEVQTLTNEGAASIDNAGTIVTGDGVLTNTGPDATITNRATGVIDADLVTSGVVTTAGQVTGTTTINGGSVEVNGVTDGTLELVGTTTVTAGTFTLTSGDVGALVNEAASDGTTDITVTAGNVASLLNTSGDALLNGGEVLGTTTVTAGTVTVAGATLTGLATVNGGNYTQTSGAADGGITNNGGTVDLLGGTAGSLNNTAGTSTVTNGQVTGTTTVSGGSVVVAGTTGGTLELVGTTTVTAGTFTLASGDVGALVNEAASDGTTDITVTDGNVASLVNTSGDALLNGGEVLGTTTVTDGTVTVAGATLTGLATVNGGTYTQTSGAADGGITNNGGTVDLLGGTAGTLTNTAGTSTVTDGQVTGTTTVSGGAVVVAGTADGTLELEGTTTVTAGTFTLTSGDVGALVNEAASDGTTDITVTAGNVASLVNTSGDALLNGGEVIGTTTVTDGTVTVAGATLTGLATVNGGTYTQSAGAADGGITNNGGTVGLNGGTAASLTNTALAGASTVTGGQVTGTTTVAGGSVEVAGTTGGDVELEGATTVTAGTFTLTSGDVGALVNEAASDGTTDITVTDGNVASLENTSGDALLNGGEVLGTTTVTAGTVTVAGATLTGLATANGGTYTQSAGAADGGITNNGGTVGLNGGTAASLNNTALAGASTVTGGQVTGTTTVAGGSVEVAGTTGGALELVGTTTVTAGTFTLTSGDVGALVNEAASDGTTDITVTAGNVASLVNTSGDALLNGGTVTGTTTVTAGTVTVAGATLTGAATVASLGTLDILSGTAAAVTNDGAFSNAGTVASLSNSGTATNTGTITGDVGNTGVLTSSGTIGGDLANSGAGVATLSGVIGGALTNSDTASVAVNGNLSGLDSITQSSTGGFVVQAGTVTLDPNGTVTNSTNMELAGGTLTGVDAALTNTGGASLIVRDGATLAMDATNANGASFTLEGAMLGDLDNLGGLSLSGDLTGNLDNGASGTVTVDGVSSVSGAIANAGLFEANDAVTFGSFGNTNTLRVNNGGLLAGGVLANSGGLSVFDGGRITANVSNTGIMTLSGMTTAAGNLTNQATGVVNVAGATTVGGTLTNVAGGQINMANGVVGDRIIVQGDAVLNGTVQMDVDLTGTPDGFDRINVAGSLSGAPVIAFSPIGGDPALLPDNYDILTYGGVTSLNPTTTGLPTDGAVLYQLSDVGGAWRLNSGANPAIGGLASGLALTQSLIGSVVNRPSSPFVTGLAAAEEDPCGYGNWARATGGRADAKGTSQTALGTFGGELSAEYAGVQFGFDYACSGGTYNGWDLSFGGTIGMNTGSTSQPVFQFDPNLRSLNPNAISSINKTDFSQTYGGLYVGAARDRLFADLQVRADRTEFDLTNIVLPGGVSLGVADQEYSSRGQTLSGSIGYSFPINPEQGLSLVPGVGFSFSNVKVGDLRFTNDPNDPGDDGLLQIDDVKSRIGFVSLTLAKSQVLPDEISAISYFGTATLYEDFASGTRSNYFTSVDANGAPLGSPLTSTSSNLGAYGELSVGLNYTKLLDDGAAVPARQLDASVRVDSRFSDKLDSWGVTAQVRLQF